MKKLIIAVAALLAALIVGATAAMAQYVEGQHYVRLEQPVRTADPAKIEVAEFFAYSSPHCFHFEPLLQSWQKRQRRDVYLLQAHAEWEPQMEPLMRGYYTSLTLKVQDKTHMAVFNLLHTQPRNLASAEAWTDFFAGYGVDKARALSTYNSFSVSSQIKQAEARARGYKVSGVPEMVVDGRYRISSRLTGDYEEMLKVVDFLVVKVRKERATRAAR